jgi:hypothetical protein
VLIREAVRRRCYEVLARTLRSDLGDIVGAVQIGGDSSRRTGAAFTEVLTSKRRPRQA